MREIEKMTELATGTGYFSFGDFLVTSVAERDHLYHLLLTARGRWVTTTRKIAGSRAGPNHPNPRSRTAYERWTSSPGLTRALRIRG